MRILTLAVMLIIALQVSALGAQPSAQDYFDKASVEYLLGNFDKAFNYLQNSLELKPNDPGALELKRSIMREKSSFNQTLKSNLAAGKKLLAQGEYAKAADVFNSVLILAPNNPEALRVMAEIEVRLKERDTEKRLIFIQAAGFFAIGVIALCWLFIRTRRHLKKWTNLQPVTPHKVTECFNCHEKIAPNSDICPNCGAYIGSVIRAAITKEQKLWYKKTGWRKNPFTLDIHPELFTGYRNQIKQVLEKVAARSGHILITGQLGVGKTTLLRWLTNYLRADCFAVYIPRPLQSIDEVIRLVYQYIGYRPKNDDEYDIYHLDKLRRSLGKSLVLLLDEAHEFSIDIERPLRTLGDLDDVKLVMAGLPETVDKLKNEIQPLYERLVLSITLEHLSFDELKELIRVRIENCGGNGTHPFTAAALEKIMEISKGIPRPAIKLCDAAVTRAINIGEDTISAETVEHIDKGVRLT